MVNHASANLADWILRRVTDSQRASELVGDQLESRPEQSQFGFWLAISWLVILFSWRTVVGVLAAAVAGGLLGWIPFAWSLTRLWAIELRSQGPPPNGGLYIAASMLLWNAAIFFLIRFGVRSSLTWMAVSSAILSSFAVCTFWMRDGMLWIAAGAVALLLVFLWNARDRRALAVLLSSVAAGGLMLYALLKIPLNPRTLPVNWITAIALLELLLTVVAQGCAARFAHKRLFRSRYPQQIQAL